MSPVLRLEREQPQQSSPSATPVDDLITALVRRNTELRVLVEEQARWVHERYHRREDVEWTRCKRRECLMAQEGRLP